MENNVETQKGWGELSYEQLLRLESPSKFATTEQLLMMAKSAEGTNRSVDLAVFTPEVDINGAHILALTLPHNDFAEMRTMWLCKMRDTTEPVKIWLDLPTDSVGYAIYKGLPTTADASESFQEFGADAG